MDCFEGGDSNLLNFAIDVLTLARRLVQRNFLYLEVLRLLRKLADQR